MQVTSGSHLWAVIGVATVVGLLVGSFLNVVAYRAPLGLSVSRPRSFCPTCHRTLRWWENVPVISWLALRGRCRTCHEPISVRYPLVEAGTGTVFALITWAWGGSMLAGGYYVLATSAIAVALIEYGGRRAPLAVAAVGAVIGQAVLVATAAWNDRWDILVWSLVGLTAGSAALAVLRARDPDCVDRRFHGRTLLPLVGCWLGGIGGGPVVAGGAGWLLAEAACLGVVSWRIRGGTPPDAVGIRVEEIPGLACGRAGDCGGAGPCAVGDCDGGVCSRDSGPATPGKVVPVVSTRSAVDVVTSVPLVTGIAVAMIVSLSVAG